MSYIFPLLQKEFVWVRQIMEQGMEDPKDKAPLVSCERREGWMFLTTKGKTKAHLTSKYGTNK